LQAAIVDQYLDVQDPKGNLVQHIDISPQGPDVDYVNAILRGALKQMGLRRGRAPSVTATPAMNSPPPLSASMSIWHGLMKKRPRRKVGKPLPMCAWK
jgi:hypothetical protein